MTVPETSEREHRWNNDHECTHCHIGYESQLRDEPCPGEPQEDPYINDPFESVRQRSEQGRAPGCTCADPLANSNPEFTPGCPVHWVGTKDDLPSRCCDAGHRYGAAAERARIVAWMRSTPDPDDPDVRSGEGYVCGNVADAIAAGMHMQGEGSDHA